MTRRRTRPGTTSLRALALASTLVLASVALASAPDSERQADRRELAALMAQLYGAGPATASGAPPPPADAASARKLLSEIVGKMRLRKPPAPRRAARKPAPPRRPRPLVRRPPPSAPVLEGPCAAPPPFSTRTETVLRLSLAELLDQVRRQNDLLLSNRLEFEVAGHGVLAARSVFELQFVATGMHEENQIRNSVEQALQRATQGEFLEFNERWDAAFEQLLPTGGKLRAGYHLDDLNNNLQQLAPGGDLFNEFRTTAGITLTQPLLRNGGHRVTGAKVRVAEKDREIAFQIYRREMLRILAEAGAAYWELAKHTQRLVIFQKSCDIAAQLVKFNESRTRSGLIPETELLEAQVGLSLRRSQQDEARRDLVRAANRVRSFLYRTPLEDARDIVTADDFETEQVSGDLAHHLRQAMSRAPEYLIARIKAAREGFKEDFARNQARAQLDFKSGYAVNGLDTSPDASISDAFTTQHPTWSVGVEMKVPLSGNRLGKAELSVASDRRRQAEIEVRTVTVDVANALDSGLKAVQLTARQMLEHEGMVATRRRILDTEFSRLEKGLSTSRALLQRDDDLNRILEDQLEAGISHEKAVLALEVTRGTLLERFGLEPTMWRTAPPEVRAR